MRVFIRLIRHIGLVVALGVALAFPVHANVALEEDLMSDASDVRFYGRLLVCDSEFLVRKLVEARGDEFVRILTFAVDETRACHIEKNPLLGPRTFLGLTATEYGVVCRIRYETSAGPRFIYKYAKSESFLKRCNTQ